MRRSYPWLLCAAAFVSTASPAASKISLLRGGLGFLFPDHNSFSNPGQFSVSHGMAVEAMYSRVHDSSEQTATPSFVFGNGRFGLGVYGQRESQSSLTDKTSSSDSVGGGLGVSFAKERVTLGVGYDRSLDTPADHEGLARVQLTIKGPQRKGPAIGFEAITTLQHTRKDIRAGLVAVGYSFRSNFSIEAVARANDIDDFKDLTGSAFFNWASQVVYLGLGYGWLNKTSHHQVEGRLGVMLGKHIDLSVIGARVFGPDWTTYGGTLRASF